MWLTVVKFTALAVVVLGVMVFVVVYIRKVRANGMPEVDPSQYVAQIFVPPQTPKPEWATWGDDEIADDEPPQRNT